LKRLEKRGVLRGDVLQVRQGLLKFKNEGEKPRAEFSLAVRIGFDGACNCLCGVIERQVQVVNGNPFVARTRSEDQVIDPARQYIEFIVGAGS
jgi:hypothetical protein